MNFDPKFTTFVQGSTIKNIQNCDKSFFDPKMRSPLEVSVTGVMFSVHGDSVRPILPLRTFSVGFEQ